MYGEAENAFGRALQLLNILPVSKSDLATAIDGLGTVYMETGNLSEAEHAELKALKIRMDTSLQLDTARSWYHLATLYLTEHHVWKAKNLAQRAFDTFSANVSAAPEDTIGSLLVLASSLRQSHKYPEAIARMQYAVQMSKEAYGPDSFPTGFSTFLLGYTYWKDGDLLSADELMRHGAEIIDMKLGWQHPSHLLIMTQYARFLRDDRRAEAAQAIEQRVMKERAELEADAAHGQLPNSVLIFDSASAERGK